MADTPGKPWYAIAFFLLASAVISDYCLYDDWRTHEKQFNTSWKWLYVNSLLLTVLTVGVGLWLLYRHCFTAVRCLTSCVLTLSCLKGPLEFIFWLSLVGYSVLCVMLVAHLHHDPDRVSDLEDDSRNLFIAYVSQLVGGFLVLFTIAVWVVSWPCRRSKKSAMVPPTSSTARAEALAGQPLTSGQPVQY